MIKLIAALVIAALMLTGAAVAVPEEIVNAVPAMNQNPETPVITDELTAAEAEILAVAYAGLVTDEVKNLHSEYDVDDGVAHYDVEFRHGDYEYDSAVHAVTGEVLKQDKEYDPPKQTKPAETAPDETKPAETGPAQTQPVKTELTKDEAIAIALAHAGLTEGDVTGLRGEYDIDDGRPEWEIEFRSGDYEYDYTIHGETGKILKKDKEYDPPKKTAAATEPPATEPPATQAPAQKLTKDEVIAIALAHAGVTADEATRIRAEYDVDDGMPEWDVEFRVGNMEYEYTIHAETGKILEWDKDRDD